jgi:hypothetical protein
VANDRNLFRIVVIEVLIYFNLAAILKTCVSISATLQLIERARDTLNRIGVMQWENGQ